jgi:metal-responsive CopG/Arc/MetJ family transcriptional regulator
MYGSLRNVRKTTIYLPDDLRRALDAAARESGQSQADLIRRAVRAYLADRPQALPASIGRHRGGTFAARDDEALLEEAWGARRGPQPA